MEMKFNSWKEYFTFYVFLSWIQEKYTVKCKDNCSANFYATAEATALLTTVEYTAKFTICELWFQSQNIDRKSEINYVFGSHVEQ